MEKSLVYYFLALYASDYSDNLYIKYLLGGAVETGSTLIGQVVIHHVGRRTFLTHCLVLPGICLLCIMVVPKGKEVIEGKLCKTKS